MTRFSVSQRSQVQVPVDPVELLAGLGHPGPGLVSWEAAPWETWHRGIRKALAHKAITDISSQRTIYRLLHVHCAGRRPGVTAHEPDQ